MFKITVTTESDVPATDEYFILTRNTIQEVQRVKELLRKIAPDGSTHTVKVERI